MTLDLGRGSKNRRFDQIVLITVAALAGFVIVVIANLLIYPAITKQEDAFVLENAEIQDVGFLRKLDAIKNQDAYRDRDQLPVYVHRLKHGSGTIFAWRSYSGGQPFIIDDESYWKVTAWIAEPPPTATRTISLGDESKAVLIVTEGGSAWPRNACSGYGASGTITVTPLGRRFRISVHAQIQAAGRPAPRCGIERVDQNFTAKKIAFEDLTPWLGIAGRHPYAETYRH